MEYWQETYYKPRLIVDFPKSRHYPSVSPTKFWVRSYYGNWKPFYSWQKALDYVIEITTAHHKKELRD